MSSGNYTSNVSLSSSTSSNLNHHHHDPVATTTTAALMTVLSDPVASPNRVKTTDGTVAAATSTVVSSRVAADLSNCSSTGAADDSLVRGVAGLRVTPKRVSRGGGGGEMHHVLALERLRKIRQMNNVILVRTDLSPSDVFDRIADALRKQSIRFSLKG